MAFDVVLLRLLSGTAAATSATAATTNVVLRPLILILSLAGLCGCWFVWVLVQGR